MSWFDDFFEYLRWRAAVAIQAGMSDAVRGDIEQGTAVRHRQAAGQLEQHLAEVRGGAAALPASAEAVPEPEPVERPVTSEAAGRAVPPAAQPTPPVANGEASGRQELTPPASPTSEPAAGGFDARLAQAPGVLSRQLSVPQKGKQQSGTRSRPGQRKEGE